MSGSRIAGLGEGEGRKAWLLFLSLGRDHATRAVEGREVPKHEATNFAAFVLKLKHPFPVRLACADDAASACLILARGLVAAARPEDRAAMGRFLLAGLGFLDRVITDDGHAMAALSRRIAGDTDD